MTGKDLAFWLALPLPPALGADEIPGVQLTLLQRSCPSFLSQSHTHAHTFNPRRVLASWLLVPTTANAKEAGSEKTEIRKGTETETERGTGIGVGIERGTEIGIGIIRVAVAAKMGEDVLVVHAALEEVIEISETTASY